MKCPNCFDPARGYNTGECDQDGYLDCTLCDTAEKRLALNAAIKAMPPMIVEDQNFHAYMLGTEAEAHDIRVLLMSLECMYKHAVELDEAGYFKDPDNSDDDRLAWQADVQASALTIAMFRKRLA